MYCVLRQQTSQPSHVTKRNRNKLWKPRTIDKKGEFTMKPAKPRHFFFVDVDVHILALLLFFLQLVYSVFFVELKSVSHYHGHMAHHINKKKKRKSTGEDIHLHILFSSFQLFFFLSIFFKAYCVCSM